MERRHSSHRPARRRVPFFTFYGYIRPQICRSPTSSFSLLRRSGNPANTLCPICHAPLGDAPFQPVGERKSTYGGEVGAASCPFGVRG